MCGHIRAEMIPFSMGQALKRLRGDLCPYAHMVISDLLMLFLWPYWDGLAWGLMCVCACVLTWGQVCADADHVQPKPLNPESSKHLRDAEFIFLLFQGNFLVIFFFTGRSGRNCYHMNVLLVNCVKNFFHFFFCKTVSRKLSLCQK